MIKIIDLDGLFDKYISDYVYKNIGKVKPEEIENQMPVLYQKFGDEKLCELDGETPNAFYKQFSGKQLIECLKTHIEKRVSVSDFLYEAIFSKEDANDLLIDSLNDDDNEEFIAYVMNLILDLNKKVPLNKYLDFILSDYPDMISELATETLIKFADDVKDIILKEIQSVSGKKRERLVDILCNCKKDDKVFDVLVVEFTKNTDNYPLYASFLAKYGDERALPFLMTAIEDEKISYADFEELRFAIEVLGGEYNKVRDFSKEKTFKKIVGEVRTPQ